MSRKTRKLIWSAPLVAVLAVAGALAMFAAPGPGSVFANPLPAAPMNLTVEAADGDAGRTTLVLDWDAAANASGYRIDISDQGAVWETMMMDTDSTATTYTDDTLTADDTRWYRVFALNSHGVGPVSNAASGISDEKVRPGSVMKLMAVPNAKNPRSALDLSWDEPASDGGEKIVGYEVQFHNGADWVPFGANPTADNVSVTTKMELTDSMDLDPGDDRMYRVRAINGPDAVTADDNVEPTPTENTVSKDWARITGTTAAAAAPGQVTGLTAVNTGAAEISLYWYAPEDTGGWDISGYLIQARHEGKKFQSVPSSDDITIPDSAPTVALGSDPTADNANVIIPVPTAGVAQIAFANIASTVDTNDDGTDDAQGRWYFQVFALTIDDGANEATDDAGLADDVTRRSSRASTVASDIAAARAIDHDGDADRTDNQTVTPEVDPLAPPVINPTGSDGDTDNKKQQIDLELTLNADIVTNNAIAAPQRVARTPVVQIAYRIDYSEDAGVTWKLLERDTRFTGFSSTKPYEDDKGLAFDEQRHYRVFAIGRHPYTDVGPPSVLAEGSTRASTAPKKPTGVMASAPSLMSIMASWTAPEDNGGQDIVKYYYQYIEDDGDDVAEDADFDTGTNNDGTLVNGTTEDAMTMDTFINLTLASDEVYAFRVAGVNKDPASEPPNADRPANAAAVADADWSAPVLFSTTEAAKPNAVEGLTSELATDASGNNRGVNLLWNRPSDKIAITGYEVEVQDDGGDWVSPRGGGDEDASRTSFTDSDELTADDIAAGETRLYRVRATNGVGEGPWTRVYYPRQPAMVHAPGKPTAVTAEKDSAAPTSQIKVSWSAPASGAEVTGYIIERRHAGDMMGDILSDGYNAGVMGASHAFMDYKEWWETLNCKGMLAVAGSSASDTATEGESAQDIADRGMYCKHFDSTAPTSMDFPAAKEISEATAMKVKDLFMKRYVTDDMGKTMTMFTGMMYTDMGLMANTEYTYRVRAIHGMKAGMWSDKAMVTTTTDNTDPVKVGAIPAVTVMAGEMSDPITLGEYFRDADDDPLTYGTPTSSNDAVATATIGVDDTDPGPPVQTLTIAGHMAGEATITVTAGDDMGGMMATQVIKVTVTAAATAELMAPTMVMASSNAPRTLNLEWEGGENAELFILVAYNIATGQIQLSTESDPAARAGDVTGLTPGSQYLGLVIAVRGSGADLESLYDYDRTNPITMSQ